jgi:hypothetical protein
MSQKTRILVKPVEGVTALLVFAAQSSAAAGGFSVASAGQIIAIKELQYTNNSFG